MSSINFVLRLYEIKLKTNESDVKFFWENVSESSWISNVFVRATLNNVNSAQNESRKKSNKEPWGNLSQYELDTDPIAVNDIGENAGSNLKFLDDGVALNISTDLVWTFDSVTFLEQLLNSDRHPSNSEENQPFGIRLQICSKNITNNQNFVLFDTNLDKSHKILERAFALDGTDEIGDLNIEGITGADTPMFAQLKKTVPEDDETYQTYIKLQIVLEENETDSHYAVSSFSESDCEDTFLTNDPIRLNSNGYGKADRFELGELDDDSQSSYRSRPRSYANIDKMLFKRLQSPTYLIDKHFMDSEDEFKASEDSDAVSYSALPGNANAKFSSNLIDQYDIKAPRIDFRAPFDPMHTVNFDNFSDNSEYASSSWRDDETSESSESSLAFDLWKSRLKKLITRVFNDEFQSCITDQKRKSDALAGSFRTDDKIKTTTRLFHDYSAIESSLDELEQISKLLTEEYSKVIDQKKILSPFIWVNQGNLSLSSGAETLHLAAHDSDSSNELNNLYASFLEISEQKKIAREKNERIARSLREEYHFQYANEYRKALEKKEKWIARVNALSKELDSLKCERLLIASSIEDHAPKESENAEPPNQNVNIVPNRSIVSKRIEKMEKLGADLQNMMKDKESVDKELMGLKKELSEARSMRDSMVKKWVALTLEARELDKLTIFTQG